MGQLYLSVIWLYCNMDISPHPDSGPMCSINWIVIANSFSQNITDKHIAVGPGEAFKVWTSTTQMLNTTRRMADLQIWLNKFFTWIDKSVTNRHFWNLNKWKKTIWLQNLPTFLFINNGHGCASKTCENAFKKSRTRGYKTPVPVKGTGCDEMNILWPNDSIRFVRLGYKI